MDNIFHRNTLILQRWTFPLDRIKFQPGPSIRNLQQKITLYTFFFYESGASKHKSYISEATTLLPKRPKPRSHMELITVIDEIYLHFFNTLIMCFYMMHGGHS